MPAYFDSLLLPSLRSSWARLLLSSALFFRWAVILFVIDSLVHFTYSSEAIELYATPRANMYMTALMVQRNKRGLVGLTMSMTSLIDLVFVEERFYFSNLYLKDKKTFNIATILKLAAKLKIERREKAVLTVVRRHQALRTRYL